MRIVVDEYPLHASDCPFFEEKQEDEFCNREYKIEQEV